MSSVLSQMLIGAGIPVDPYPAYRYWRLRTSGTIPSGYWQINSHTVVAIISEAGDLSGTNIGASLTFGTNAGWNDSSAAGYTQTTGANPFASTAVTNYVSTVLNSTMYFDFGSPKKFASLRTTAPLGYEDRQPTTMYLEGSTNNSTWTAVATLTNAGSLNTPYFRNLVPGATVAATSS